MNYQVMIGANKELSDVFGISKFQVTIKDDFRAGILVDLEQEQAPFYMFQNAPFDSFNAKISIDKELGSFVFVSHGSKLSFQNILIKSLENQTVLLREELARLKASEFSADNYLDSFFADSQQNQSLSDSKSSSSSPLSQQQSLLQNKIKLHSEYAKVLLSLKNYAPEAMACIRNDRDDSKMVIAAFNNKVRPNEKLVLVLQLSSQFVEEMNNCLVVNS